MELVLDTKKKIFFIGAVIFILTVIVSYNLVYRANVGKINQLRVKIDDAKKTNVLLADINKLQDKMDPYLQMRSDTQDASSFLSRIADIASGCGIKIDSINPGKTIQDRGCIFLPCKITFEVPYQRLRSFIGRLENDKKFIRVDSLSIAPIKTARKTSEADSFEAGPMEIEDRQISADMPKESKEEGVWVRVNMELVGFYSD